MCPVRQTACRGDRSKTLVTSMFDDRSNGYDSVAAAFVAHRSDSRVGVQTVRDWARALPRGATILDLGCGHGVPISATLLEEGANVFGVDASPTLISAFRTRFPDAPAECETAEESTFFDRSFDAVIAWGLMFLLPPEAQQRLIAKVSTALKPGGGFLFTAPAQACEWSDNLTSRTSVSWCRRIPRARRGGRPACCA